MNKTMTASLLFLMLALAGCGSNESDEPVPPAAAPVPTSPPQMVEKEVTHGMPESPPEAAHGPVDYIDTVVTLGMQQDYRMKKSTVEEAVQQYYAMNMKYPASIEDLVKEGLLVKAPSLDETDHWDINAQTGQVRIMRRVPKP